MDPVHEASCPGTEPALHTLLLSGVFRAAKPPTGYLDPRISLALKMNTWAKPVQRRPPDRGVLFGS